MNSNEGAVPCLVTRSSDYSHLDGVIGDLNRDVAAARRTQTLQELGAVHSLEVGHVDEISKPIKRQSLARAPLALSALADSPENAGDPAKGIAHLEVLRKSF